MNKKVYGICSGEYSDYHIDYIFESEETRDKILEKLNFGKDEDDYNYYGKTNFELSDNKFNLNECKDINYVKCSYEVDNETNNENFSFDIKKQIL